MALTVKRVGKLVDRPWGTECRVDYADDVGQIYNEELSWPVKVKVDEKMIGKAVEDRRLRLEDRLAHPIEDPPSETEILKLEIAVKDAELIAKAEEIRKLTDEVTALKGGK